MALPQVEARFLGKARLKQMALRRDEVEMDMAQLAEKRRAEVEADMHAFFKSMSSSRSFLKSEGHELFNTLEAHRDVTYQVQVGCENMEKMLTALENDIDASSLTRRKTCAVAGADADDNASAQLQRDEKEGVYNQPQKKRRFNVMNDPFEIKQLRAFAAEDTTMEGSMSNYSVEPDNVPPNASLERYLSEICVSLDKVRDSAKKLREILENNVQYWASTLTMRRIKTHVLRCNYHARRVCLWGNYSRQTLLIDATSINKLASNASSEIRLHQTNMQKLQTRKVVAALKSAELDREAGNLQQILSVALEEKAVQELQLLKAGRASLKMPSLSQADVPRIESVMLLDKLTMVKELAEDVEMFKSWLYLQTTFPS